MMTNRPARYAGLLTDIEPFGSDQFSAMRDGAIRTAAVGPSPAAGTNLVERFQRHVAIEPAAAFFKSEWAIRRRRHGR